MAYIDKIYANSYQEYIEFKNWANKQIITYFNGHTVHIKHWIWDYKEEDFLDGSIPIMNTPTWLDTYLIQNCKNQFVIDRMKEVYSKETYKKLQAVDLTAKPSDDFQQNRKIIIKRNKRSKFPIHNKPYSNKMKWRLVCNDDFDYCSESKVWSSYNSCYPYDANVAYIGSIKGIIRHLRKQYLPKNISFTIMGIYVGEEYTIYIN